ncbi:hypothetical protein WR25_16550 [Diploscapter pachys]|uniref:Uncharacterized protein n=1 Tax=Diploscapter pachys TaxID=2018661 RepID=A0A2A2J450_9BILA|nr:hypothetical protein WR25_16550 [Diploscapter pachys]
MSPLNKTQNPLPELCFEKQWLQQVQEALSEEFDGIECSIGPGPVLSQVPFSLSFSHLGRGVTYVPDLSCIDGFDSNGFHKIPLGKNSALFTDGLSGCCLELALGRGRDWKTPLIQLFDRLYPNKWAFFVTELEHSQPTYHVLSCHGPPVSSQRREDTPDSTQSSQVSSPTASVSESTSFTLWLVPVSRIFAVPPPPKKVRIVKKIVKKKSPTNAEGAAETNGTNGTTTNGATTNGTTTNGTTKEKKVVTRVVKKPVEKKESPVKEMKEPKEPTPEMDKGKNSSGSTIAAESSSNLDQLSANGKMHNGHSDWAMSEKSEKIDKSDDENSIAELRKKLLSSTSSNKLEERFLVNGEPRRLGLSSLTNGFTNGSGNSLNGLLGGLSSSSLSGIRPSHSHSRVSVTPDKRLDPIYEGKGRKERSFSPVKTHTQQIVCRVSHPSTSNIPVLALQMIFQKCFNYEQLGRLREVHPHWDELAGQLLNSGYYKVLERSDKLLMQLQRKLPSDPSLSYPTSVLTNIQVHILNPVDVMRAVIDEGVCCFPYGMILDKTFLLLDQIQLLLMGGEHPKINWEPVALLAKKAALHYRQYLEKVMEERMGENFRLKAAQRIIRLDSFMVETNIKALEKETFKAKDELRYELEQLKEQNTQLRRDNRTLKQEQMKLETRVEVLEGKFKTLARLLS